MIANIELIIDEQRHKIERENKHVGLIFQSLWLYYPYFFCRKETATIPNLKLSTLFLTHVWFQEQCTKHCGWETRQ